MGLAFFNQMRRRATATEPATDVATAEPVAVVDLTAPPAATDATAAPDAAADVAALPAWTLKQPPAEYLKRTPDGKHAALARQILAAEG